MGRRNSTSTETNETGTASGAAKNEGTGNSTRTGTTKNTGTASGTRTEETVIPKLVTVNVPGKENEPNADDEKKRKTAERQKRYRAKKKATGSATSKASVNTQQMEVLLVTLSNILASRPGMQVWAFTPEEAKQIVTPLSAILKKHDVGEQIGEYADYIALVTACLTIFIPKCLIWTATRPRKEEKTNVRQPTNSQPANPVKQSGTAATDNRPTNRPNAGINTNVSRSIAEILPASISSF